MRQRTKELNLESNQEEKPPSRRLSRVSKYESPQVTELISSIKKIDLLKVDLFQEDQPIRWNKIRLMAELLGLMIIDQLLEGSSKIDSLLGITRCSLPWFIVFMTFCLLCYLISVSFVQAIKDEQALSDLFDSVLMKKIHTEDEGFVIAKSSDDQITRITYIAFIGGIAAGMLGIGGGIVIAPLLLDIGVNPKVASSTSNFLLVFSSSSGTILFLLAVSALT